MEERGTQADALQIIRGVHAVDEMRNDINDMLMAMRIAVNEYACGEWQLTPEWRAKVVIHDACNPGIYLYWNGVEKGLYHPPAHMLPLAVIQPLWERLGDFVKTSEVEGKAAVKKLDIFRRAAQALPA